MSEVEKVAQSIYVGLEKTTPEAWDELVAGAASDDMDAPLAAEYVADIRAAAQAAIAAIDEARGHELRGALLSQMALVAAAGGEVRVSQDDIANLFRVQLEKLDDLTTGGYIFRLRPLPAPPKGGA